MSIQILAPEVIDQISAGEVVERPAHLVKELIENSLDAGATEIEIEVDDGGKRVLVRDNGRGIASYELTKALARHATSKICEADDLWNLNSYGFRGEALASISAVSELTMTSQKQEGEESAYQVKSRFGKLSTPVPVGGDRGTSVEIKNLFSNVPARLKFLKSDGAEISQIKQVIKALALSSPQVSVRVRVKNKLLFFWPAAPTLLERAEQVLELKNLYFIEDQENGIHVKICFSAPHHSVNHSRQLWFFVRGRWVLDRGLNAAVMEAYRHLLMGGEYPIVALWLDLSPEDVDVNIHPTKSQIKFRDSSQVFRVVVHALRKGLAKSPWLSDVMMTSLSTSAPNSTSSLLPAATSVPTPLAPFSVAEINRIQYPQKTSYQVVSGSPILDVASHFISDSELDRSSHLHLDSEASSCASSVLQSPSSSPLWGSLQVVGQVQLTYIVAQSDKGMVLIDQHAAHERVMFESLMESWREGKMDVQHLLLPLRIEMDPTLLEGVLPYLPNLKKMGFEIEQGAPQLLLVTSHPALLQASAIEKGLHLLGEEIAEYGGSFAVEKKVGEWMATMACHSAIRAGQALNIEQMQSLLRQMDQYSFSSFCPHGRPVFVEYPTQKIERDFGRLG